MDKKITISAIISPISALLLILEISSIISIGKFLNQFLHCEQILENSFPCYGIYDIYAIIFFSIVTILSLVYLLIKIYWRKHP